MSLKLFSKLLTCFLMITQSLSIFSAEEDFILMDGATEEIILKEGSSLDEPFTPCSTFKIALSLMGYDAGVLIDHKNPVWPFKEGYDTYLETWKASQTPESWMKNSCIWYSKLLAQELGLEKINSYLAAFNYGNQNMSGGLTRAWLSSSLKISPKGQVLFIQKMLSRKLSVSTKAIQTTKSLLFINDLSEGWSLFGKTGLGTITDSTSQNLEIGWFVGWIEKDNQFFPFAYCIRDTKIDASLRIPKVNWFLKQFFMQSCSYSK